MPRRCTICEHPERAKIDAGVAAGESYRTLSQRFAVSVHALGRHVRLHMAQALAKAHRRVEAAIVREVVERKTAQGLADVDLYGVVLDYHQRALKLFDACDRWLTDPRDPAKYNLDPRAMEIEVAYLEVVGEKSDGSDLVALRVATLQDLLDRIRGAGEVVAVKYRAADPRVLVLRTAQLLQTQVKAISAILAAKPPESDEEQLTRSAAWAAVRSKIGAALRPHPEALRAVLAALGRDGDVAGE